MTTTTRDIKGRCFFFLRLKMDSIIGNPILFKSLLVVKRYILVDEEICNAICFPSGK